MARRDQIEQLLKDDPNDAFLLYALALEYAKAGDAPEALHRLADLIQQDPDYVAAYFQMGQILAETGDAEAAREIVRKGVAAAQRIGDTHAAGEMSGFLEML